LVPNDGRSKRYGKKTTEREHIRMGDRVITLFRYTENETRYKNPNWYARCYLDGATRQVSTKEEDVRKARTFAKKWYALMLARIDEGLPTGRIHKSPHLFDEVAQEILEQWKQYSEDGTRNAAYWKDHYWRYNAYIQPFFKKDYVEDITTPRLVQWQKWRQRKRLVSDILHVGELKKEYTVIFQILKYSQELGYIQHLPTKPRTVLRQLASSKNPPSRATFTSEEYKHLLSVSRKRIAEAKHLVDNPPKTGGGYPRILTARRYIHYFIIFLAASGVRPGEANRILHMNVKKVKHKDDKKCYLSVWIKGKKGDRKVLVKYGGYFAYLGLCEKVCPDYKPEDLVFPRIPRGGLRDLIIDADLRYTQNGDKRDSKSLRHFYIMQGLANKTPPKAMCIQCDVSPTIMKNHYERHATVDLFKDDLLKVGDFQSP
jgi:hypothetical protein